MDFQLRGTSIANLWNINLKFEFMAHTLMASLEFQMDIGNFWLYAKNLSIWMFCIPILKSVTSDEFLINLTSVGIFKNLLSTVFHLKIILIFITFVFNKFNYLNFFYDLLFFYSWHFFKCIFGVFLNFKVLILFKMLIISRLRIFRNS